MTKITSIIFDFGGVLVDYDFAKFFITLRANSNCSNETFNKFCDLMLDEALYSSLDRELIPFDEQIEELKRQHPDCADLFDNSNKRFQEVVTGEVPGMHRLLTDLKRQGYAVYGLSNWSSKVYETMKQYQHIFGLLDDRILSCEEHLLKPEPEIYQCALNRFGRTAGECVFVDDKQANIDGCIAAGIHGIRFTGADTLRNALQRLGVNI